MRVYVVDVVGVAPSRRSERLGRPIVVGDHTGRNHVAASRDEHAVVLVVRRLASLAKVSEACIVPDDSSQLSTCSSQECPSLHAVALIRLETVHAFPPFGTARSRSRQCCRAILAAEAICAMASQPDHVDARPAVEHGALEHSFFSSLQRSRRPPVVASVRKRTCRRVITAADVHVDSRTALPTSRGTVFRSAGTQLCWRSTCIRSPLRTRPGWQPGGTRRQRFAASVADKTTLERAVPSLQIGETPAQSTAPHVPLSAALHASATGPTPSV